MTIETNPTRALLFHSDVLLKVTEAKALRSQWVQHKAELNASRKRLKRMRWVQDQEARTDKESLALKYAFENFPESFEEEQERLKQRIQSLSNAVTHLKCNYHSEREERRCMHLVQAILHGKTYDECEPTRKSDVIVSKLKKAFHQATGSTFEGGIDLWVREGNLNLLDPALRNMIETNKIRAEIKTLKRKSKDAHYAWESSKRRVVETRKALKKQVEDAQKAEQRAKELVSLYEESFATANDKISVLKESLKELKQGVAA